LKGEKELDRGKKGNTKKLAISLPYVVKSDSDRVHPPKYKRKINHYHHNSQGRTEVRKTASDWGVGISRGDGEAEIGREGTFGGDYPGQVKGRREKILQRGPV